MSSRHSYLPRWLEIPAAFLARLLYRVRSRGAERMPASGGVLLLPNHLSYIDGIVLQLACPRPIRFAGYEGFQENLFFRWAYRLTATIPISPHNALEAT